LASSQARLLPFSFVREYHDEALPLLAARTGTAVIFLTIRPLDGR
jgi:hypothetical protein